MINESIAKLVKYGENAGLVSGLDKIYATNRILEVMQISDYEEPEQIPETPDLEETLNELLDDAAKRGLLEHNSVVYRDLFDTKLMDCLMPRPGEVVKKFEELYAKSPQEATDYFYKLSQDSNYIRRYRIAKDIRWSVPSAYGDIDISINLSKPEKDPKAIAAAKLAKQSGYPKCLLCKENVGYAGRVNHPARQNHRINLSHSSPGCNCVSPQFIDKNLNGEIGNIIHHRFQSCRKSNPENCPQRPEIKTNLMKFQTINILCAHQEPGYKDGTDCLAADCCKCNTEDSHMEDHYKYNIQQNIQQTGNDQHIER